jgi:hypothetical protein
MPEIVPTKAPIFHPGPKSAHIQVKANLQIMLKPPAICSTASSNFGLNTDICAPLNVKIN